MGEVIEKGLAKLSSVPTVSATPASATQTTQQQADTAPDAGKKEEAKKDDDEDEDFDMLGLFD